MAVAADYGGEARSLGFQIQSRQIVKNINGDASDLDNLCFRQIARPRRCVDIAADSGNGCHAAKLLQDFWCAYVSGVNDMV